MTKYLLVLFAVFIANSAYCGDDEQTATEEPFEYITREPVKVYGYDFIQDNSLAYVTKTANSGLRFIKIGDVRLDDSLGQIYLIQFLRISDEPSELTANTTAINKLTTDNFQYYCIKATDFKEPAIVKRYKTGIHNLKANVGVLVLPIKFRPSLGDAAFNFVTDFNLGTSVGCSFRVTHYKPNYITIAGFLGVTNVGVDSATTKGYITQPDINLPAFTPGFAIIGEFTNFQVGFVIGGDFVGGTAGQKWMYNERIWYSFGLGYQFLRASDSK